MKIYYLGPVGTFSHQAALAFCDAYHLDVAELIPLQTVSWVVRQVVGEASRTHQPVLGCVPIENSIQGSVTASWDAIESFLETEQKAPGSDTVGPALPPDFHQIVAAGRMSISQNLLTVKPLSRLDKIREVYSHPQALAQCRRWIQKNMPQASVSSVDSTALAAEKVRAAKREDVAAIASAVAAGHYGLHIQAANIEDNSRNQTRFALFGQARHLSSGSLENARRCSILSLVLRGVANCPGGLYRALGNFGNVGLNLTRIESRPVGTDLGTYLFYLDVEWGSGSAVNETWMRLHEALKNLRIEVIRLGLYAEEDFSSRPPSA